MTPPPTVLTGPLYIRESFGTDPRALGIPAMERYRADGTLVPVILSQSIQGFRAEYPNTAAESWMTVDARRTPTWGFAASTPDPTEPPSPFELVGQENGVLASSVTPPSLTNNAALLNFLQPAGPVTASITVFPGPANIAVGFTPSGALAGNFENSGAAWIIVRHPLSTVAVGSWELHTRGRSGPSASGTFPFFSTWTRISVTYDPAAGTVVGSVDGVPTPTLNYRVSGVRYVGFQGNGIVNNFQVAR